MSDLKALLQKLGVCDESAAELKRELEQLPLSIAAVEARVQEAQDAVEAERVCLAEAEHRGRASERELQGCESQRDKFQSQTALVKNNHEYTALLHEVDGMTARISQLEEHILLAMEEADQATLRLQGREREHAEIERDMELEGDQLRARMIAASNQISERDKEREELIAGFDPETRARYERLRGALGIATARLHQAQCMACHRQIPPETINRVIAGELHHCGACQRILVPSEP